MPPYPISGEIHDRESVLTDGEESRSGVEKIRLAIGLFDQPSSLFSALKLLLLQGFTTDDLCVCGTADTVAMAGSVIQQKVAIKSAVIALFVDTEPYTVTKDLPTIVGSHGSFFSMFTGLMDRRQKMVSHCAFDECTKLSSDLMAHIARGRLVLMVDINEPRQLIRASRVLLRHSSYVVHTRECLQT